MIAGLGSPTHLLLILVVVLLLFGAKRLPEMGKSLARGINEFKEGLNSKDEPEEEHPEAVGEERAKADLAGDRPHNGEAAHAKGPRSSKREETDVAVP